MRPLAPKMLDALLMDAPLSPALRIDFGVDSMDHHRALQQAARDGATAEELDAALGSGPRLAALIRHRAPQWDHLNWVTAWDDMGPPPEEEVSGPRGGRTIGVVPAYGRDYQSLAAAVADYNADKDFIISDFHDPADGKPTNRAGLLEDRTIGSVKLHWKARTKQAIINVTGARK